jgi:hypothetical protein
MNPRWALDRLRAMGASEIAHRTWQFTRARAERMGLGLAKPQSPNEKRGLPWAQPLLPLQFGTDEYLRAADAILAGDFRLFGNRVWALGFPPVWNRDPASGVDAPLRFGKTLNYRDSRIVGNVKYLWEPNRHLELVTLAQAWHLSRDRRYAYACGTLLNSWIEQCPYMLGPNWSSSLELGLRLVNWSFAWHLLGGDQAALFEELSGQNLKARWLEAICRHCHFIAHHLSRYSSANNHLLGELLGLLIAASTWPSWPQSRAWLAHARGLFEREALLQNTPDGVNREQAIWYQHEVADMMLLAGLTCRANGHDFGAPYWQRLEKMLEFICACMDVGGNVPMLGDSDDAVIVRFCPMSQFNVYESLLATGAVLFGRGDFKRKARVFDDKSRWLLGDEAAGKFAALPSKTSEGATPRAFPTGGYYILGSALDTADEVRIVADCAPLGYLSLAAHVHADALSFTLSVAGQPLLVDSGTYCYHTEPEWRAYFRGTSAHNTIRVDGQDQSIAGGNFLWNTHACATCIEFRAAQTAQILVGEHDGYTQLADPVIHRRAISYLAHRRIIKVHDELICAAAHTAETFWHFHPRCIVELHAQEALVSLPGMEMRFSWSAHMDAQAVRGQDRPPLGWLSERFDTKVSTTTLALVARIAPGSGWTNTTSIEVKSAATAASKTT